MSERLDPGFRAGLDPLRRFWGAVGRLRSVPGRLRYTISRNLDAKPEELIDAALRHANASGRVPVCIAASFPLSLQEIEQLSRLPAVSGIVSKQDPRTLRQLKAEVPNANIGAFWEPGLWLIPCGTAHLYFIGSWRLITLPMLREAFRHQAVTLTARCGREWIDIPLRTIRRIAAGRRLFWSLSRRLQSSCTPARFFRALTKKVAQICRPHAAAAPRRHASDQINNGFVQVQLLPDQASLVSGQMRSLSDQVQSLAEQALSLSDQVQSLAEQALSLSDQVQSLAGQARSLSDQVQSPTDQPRSSDQPDEVASFTDTASLEARLRVEPARSAVRAFDARMLTEMINVSRQQLCPDFVPGRIVLVCGNLQPGGAERQVAYTACGVAQAASVESVQLLCDMLTPNHPARYDFYLPLIERAGVPAYVVERGAFDRTMVHEPEALALAQASFPESLLLDVANLYWEFVRLRPEVVHAWLDWSNTRAGLAAALAGVPRILLSGRNLNPTHFALYQPYMDPVYKALQALPNVQLLNNSRAGAESYADWLGIPAERIKVIYNGLQIAEIESAQGRALRERLGISADATLVGGVFRFNSEKRPLLWIDVAARIARERQDVWFVLFGQGDLQPEMENRARAHGIADRLVLPGVIEGVLPAMSALDVFLLTSFGEGVPNVVLEAQSVGTPVVATKAGGVAEAVDLGVSGWVLDTTDPAQLAERVCWLLSDARARERAGAAGAAFVRSRFGMQRMIDETLAAYELA